MTKRKPNTSYSDDGVEYCKLCRLMVDGNECCSLGCTHDIRLNEHPVDALMGSGGDPLLATGTRAMWIELFDRYKNKELA